MPLVYRKGKHGLEYRDEAPHHVGKRDAEGWSTSKADALAPKPAQPSGAVADPTAAKVDDLPVVLDDDAAPTRAELEAKADELGIKVDKRWSDKTLGEKIAAALSAEG